MATPGSWLINVNAIGVYQAKLRGGFFRLKSAEARPQRSA